MGAETGIGAGQAILAATGGVWALLSVLACVVLATLAQTLTGFAFGLVFLSLSAVFELASVADAANVATLLTVVNAVAFFRARREPLPWRMMAPALVASTLSVALGLWMLHWLSASAALLLKALLGAAILASAIALARNGRPRDTLSPPSRFVMVGCLSGLMGGLFGASGPPIVYHLYRQPLAVDLIRRSLLLMFTFNASTRLALNVSTGGISLRALVLAAIAVPLVHGLTRVAMRWQRRIDVATLRRAVAALLVVSGGALLVSAGRALWGGS